MFSIEMASRGSPVVAVRIPAELLELVDQIVARSADTRKDGPWTRSSFIIKAIEEKIEKMARSAGKTESPLPESYGRDSSAY
jgi:metal-responsive CopG/Arc/MetJ family transcriptional regulator